MANGRKKIGFETVLVEGLETDVIEALREACRREGITDTKVGAIRWACTQMVRRLTQEATRVA